MKKEQNNWSRISIIVFQCQQFDFENRCLIEDSGVAEKCRLIDIDFAFMGLVERLYYQKCQEYQKSTVRCFQSSM